MPRDLPLYAPYILQILTTVLGAKDSSDLAVLEYSLPVIQAFCAHHDVTLTHVSQYEDIVRIYASYASLKTPVQPKWGLFTHIAIRWRSAGLKALKSIASSEALGADGGKQLEILIPVILQNLNLREHLYELQEKIDSDGTYTEQDLRRRMSIARVQTNDRGSTSTSVPETPDDADSLAEEEVGIQAIKCLKQIFVANNRAQLRMATGAILSFICTDPRPGLNSQSAANRTTWAASLMEMVTRWAPVQDRFVILVTVMETLVRGRVTEENMGQQSILVFIVGSLLRSNINMIGLSVMDILLGLVQHILLLLQLSGKGTNVLPYHHQHDALIDLSKGAEGLIEGPTSSGIGEKKGVKLDETFSSSNREQLLSNLQKCFGDLSTHIYYSDQISDMITAILLRLKPSSTITERAIQDPANAHENPGSDEFFSFGTARIIALDAIKEILNRAATGRSRVGVQVFDGTQWLLKDEDRRVRQAYIDALLTWLRLEMSSNDLRALGDKRDFSSRRDDMTRRAVSSASQRERNAKPAKSTFLQLLHLAIYENAIEAPESEHDLLMIHLLLVRLVEKLGVNAVKAGLPMIMRLQEDINMDQVIPTPLAKLNIGSLVHGYLWALCDKFDFDTSTVGFVVQREISRRKQHGLWLETLQVPPLPLEQIMSASSRPLSEKTRAALQSETLKPFDSRPAMVDRIADSYANSVASPPTSPPASPGRVFSMPIMSSQNPASAFSRNELPLKIQEAMLSYWSKDICIATAEKESTRTISLNGSRKGTNLSNYLSVNGYSSRNLSPFGDRNPTRTSPPNEKDLALQSQALNFAFQNQHRHSSARDTNSLTPISSSDPNTTLRVDDLKRVLAGGTLNARGASPLRHNTIRHDFAPSNHNRSVSSSSESVASAEGYESASEGDLSRPLPPTIPNSISEQAKPRATSNYTASSTHSRTSWATHPRSRPHSGEMSPNKPSTPRSLRRPSTSSSGVGEDPTANAAALRGEIVHPRLSGEETMLEEDVPPVPPLPKGVQASNRPLSMGGLPVQHREELAVKEGREAVMKQNSAAVGRKKGVDVGALLGSIDAVAGERWRVVSGHGKPPY